MRCCALAGLLLRSSTPESSPRMTALARLSIEAYACCDYRESIVCDWSQSTAYTAPTGRRRARSAAPSPPRCRRGTRSSLPPHGCAHRYPPIAASGPARLPATSGSSGAYKMQRELNSSAGEGTFVSAHEGPSAVAVSSSGSCAADGVTPRAAPTEALSVRVQRQHNGPLRCAYQRARASTALRRTSRGRARSTHPTTTARGRTTASTPTRARAPQRACTRTRTL